MPLLDLSLVTLSLTDLIGRAVRGSPAWSNANQLEVLPLPPDKLSGENAIGFYLYHAIEETQGKSTYVPGISDVPVRYTSLGLNLYYVLTPHSDLEGAASALREQLMMGLAMKALHDFPLVTDDTLVTGQIILHPLLRGGKNHLRISLLPTKLEDSVTYWTAGQSPLRLASYYQVSVVNLEPEQPPSGAGRVLVYGVYVFPTDSARVITTSSVLTFLIPGEADARLVEATPAQVTYGDGFSVIGSAFSGDGELMIRRADWATPIPADDTWNVMITANRIEATARTTSNGVEIVPGIYAASILTRRVRSAPTGDKVFETASNESPFAITPRITNITAPDAAGNFTVIGEIFEHPDIVPEDVAVFVGGLRLSLVDAAPDEGEFNIVSDTTIQVRLPAGFTPGAQLGFRLIINGAESAPRWIIAP